MNHYAVPVFYGHGVNKDLSGCYFGPGQYRIPEFPFRDLNGQSCDTTWIRGKFSVISVSDTLDFDPESRVNSNILRVLDDVPYPEAVTAISIGIIRGKDSTPGNDSLKPGREEFITGSRDEVFRFAKCGLILPRDSIFSRLVLVDPEGRIRGYYDKNRFDEFERLSVELKILLNEEFKL